jgi:hypothetical protein
MATGVEVQDKRASAFRFLRDLELISRRISDGYSIDFWPVEKLIDLLANFPELCEVRQALEREKTTRCAHGAEGEKEDGTGTLLPVVSCPLRHTLIREMRQAWRAIELDTDDLDHRITFVNAAIECMNLLSRQVSGEHVLPDAWRSRCRGYERRRGS